MWCWRQQEECHTWMLRAPSAATDRENTLERAAS
jgi:hypothetical protein